MENEPGWPEHWPEYHNASVDACDTRKGFCACGATHLHGEFQVVESGNTLFLYRYGRVVGSKGISQL